MEVSSFRRQTPPPKKGDKENGRHPCFGEGTSCSFKGSMAHKDERKNTGGGEEMPETIPQHSLMMFDASCSPIRFESSGLPHGTFLKRHPTRP